jgi:hypothetical protein
MPRFPLVWAESVFEVPVFAGQIECVGAIVVLSSGTINDLMVDAGASTESVFEIPIFAGQPECVGAMDVLSSGTINGLMVDAGASTP